MRARRVLFVTYGAGHIAMVAPVIQALQQLEPGIHVDLLALTTGGHAARAMGLAPMGYRDFAHWYDAGVLKRHAAPLLADTRHPLIDEDETIAYLGINLEDLRQQMGAKAAAAAYAARGRWAFMPLNFMRRLLAHLKPDIVVATNSPRSEEAALSVASELGIATLCMVDLFSPAGDPFFGRGHYADAITAISPLGKGNLVAGGVPAERIHVTGNPAFSGIFAPLYRAQADADRLELGWQDLQVILWAGHLELLPPGMGRVDDPAEFPRRAERVLRDYVAAHENTALIVRYHPNHIGQFLSDGKQPRVLWSDPRERSTHRDIQLADLVVIQATTVGVEAAIAGRSVLSLDHSPSRHVFPASSQGVARGVSSFEALPAALDLAISEPFTSELASSGRDSADRVAALVTGMLDMPRP